MDVVNERETNSAELDLISIEFPRKRAGKLDQDEEWCEIELGEGDKRKIRFHDYHEIYEIPGLYEYLFYEKLKCCSPEVVCTLLKEVTEKTGSNFEKLRVLDIGAGNGMVGERLSTNGADYIVGLDILEEARMAAERDNPGIYDEYVVADLTDMSEKPISNFNSMKLNCLVTVAALGFGDIPPAAFARAYNFIEDKGYIAFNIKERFTGDNDETGFSKMIRIMSENGIIDIKEKLKYMHRLSISGDPLYYIAMVAEKRADISDDFLKYINKRVGDNGGK